MLFLDQTRTVPGAVLFRGFRDNGGPCWFVLPEAPRIGRDGGEPRLHYTLFAPLPGSSAVPLGWLSLGLDLWGSEAERSAWAAAAEVDAGAIEPFPATALSLSIEHGGTQLVRVPALRVGADLRVAASLQGDDATLLWAALAAERPALVARVVLSFYYQLATTRIRVWAEREAGASAPAGASDLKALVGRGRAGVIVDPASPLSVEYQAAIEARANDLLASALASAAPGSFSFELSLHEVHPGSLPLSGVLTPDWTDPATHLHRVELTDAIARAVTLGVVCPAFKSDVLSAIHLKIRHPADGVARKTEDALLDGAGRDHLFSTIATREESDEVAVETSIWLRDGVEPWVLPATHERSGAIVVIDPDRCGVLRVEVSASGAPWGAWQLAEVTLAVGERSGRLLLRPTELTRVWECVVRADPAPPATMSTRWMDADGRWTDPETRTVPAGRWFIAPPAPAPVAQVEVIAAGDWTELQRIVVELAAVGPAAERDVVLQVLTFTAAGQHAAWVSAVIPYRARVTLVGDWGSATGAWEAHDDLLLVVMDRERRAVEIVPTLLGVGDRVRLARVEIEDGSDTRQPPAHASFTFPAPTDPPAGSTIWRYRAGGGVPVYRWRLTLVGADGIRSDVGWRDGRGDVLVLTPPP